MRKTCLQDFILQFIVTIINSDLYPNGHVLVQTHLFSFVPARDRPGTKTEISVKIKVNSEEGKFSAIGCRISILALALSIHKQKICIIPLGFLNFSFLAFKQAGPVPLVLDLRITHELKAPGPSDYKIL